MKNVTLTVIVATLCGGCADASLRETGYLSSYSGLRPSDGLITKSKIMVASSDIQAAKTVRILPITFSEAAAAKLTKPTERTLLSNAIGRALCASLSDRLTVVGPETRAALSVRAQVSGITLTNPTAAGASKLITLGVGIVASGIPVPRMPIGLGALSIEAEAVDERGFQKAAMIWARGANSLTSSARISESGDAYDLAGAFGADFGRMLVTGEDPLKSRLPSLPSMQGIGESLGGAPRSAACEAFGRNPGLAGMIGGGLGLPPEWTDRGVGKERAARPGD